MRLLALVLLSSFLLAAPASAQDPEELPRGHENQVSVMATMLHDLDGEAPDAFGLRVDATRVRGLAVYGGDASLVLSLEDDLPEIENATYTFWAIGVRFTAGLAVGPIQLRAGGFAAVEGTNGDSRVAALDYGLSAEARLVIPTGGSVTIPISLVYDRHFARPVLERVSGDVQLVAENAGSVSIGVGVRTTF